MLKVLLTLLLISNSQAETCNPTSYSYGGKLLCFSKESKAYLTENCLDQKCDALKIYEQSLSMKEEKTLKDSRHLGAQFCLELGGKTMVVESPSTKDQLCLCVAPDSSAISCNRLGLR